MRTSKLFGWHAVDAAIRYTPKKLKAAWLDSAQKNKRSELFLQSLRDLRVVVHATDKRQLDKLSRGGHHQGVVIEVELPPELGEETLREAIGDIQGIPLFLILDQLHDPHNLGACFRAADATGVNGIVITKDRSVGLTPTVYKVASGAAETIPLYRVTNLVRTMRFLKERNIWLLGTHAGARQSVFESDLTLPLAVVIGAEGSGLRRLTMKYCDSLIRLPMCGQVESLNLSVAAGVVLYEAIRQRSRV